MEGALIEDCRYRGRWFGCKFEPRYDSVLPPDTGHLSAPNADSIEAFKNKTYIGDICIRCGRWAAKPVQSIAQGGTE